MIVSKTDPAEEIRTQAQLADIPVGSASSGKTYVWVNDITLTGAWTPIGTETDPFQGKFYGNGHKISIANITEAADMGLFGVVDGGTVRDLTVQYGGASVDPADAFRFGGIAGTVQGRAHFENVQVLGSVTLGGSGNIAYVGGLIGLMTGTGTGTGTASVTNAYGGLKLTVNTNPGSSNSLYVGGAVGSMGKPDEGGAVKVEKVNVVGDITVGSENDLVNTTSASRYNYDGLFVGGLSGFVRGSGSAEESKAKLLDSSYRQGNIRVWNGDGNGVFGGAVGRNCEYADITGCSSLAGSFIIDKDSSYIMGIYFAGGFIGDFMSLGKVENCYSDNQIVISGSSGFRADVAGGGFAGRIDGIGNGAVEVLYCYALGDVSVSGYGNVYAGGFASVFNRAGSASYCYAAGNVYAYGKWVTGNYTVFAGGFASIAYSLKDCYALGNVFADKHPSGTNYLRVGALVGAFRQGQSGTSYTVERCFAAGSVIAQRHTSGDIAIGGLMGFIDAGSATFALKNSAALGASVTYTGPDFDDNFVYPVVTRPSTSLMGRVIGNLVSCSITNNYANNGMRLYNHSTYGYSRPSEVTLLSPVPGPGTKHGEDAHAGMFRNPAFWTTGIPGYSGLGFNTEDWDFSGVVSKGYPRLRDSGGAIMGGQ
jgi:hypothetical protein